MVHQKLIVQFLILALAIPTPVFAQGRKYRVAWMGEKDGKCQEIFETFLKEFRNLSPDSEIELQTAASNGADIETECTDSSRLLVAKPGAEASAKIPMRYLRTLESFNAADVYAFQKQFLSPVSLADLAPADLPVSAIEKTEVLSPETSTPFYKRWWFWGIVAASAGAAAYFIVKGQERQALQIEFQ